MNINFLKYAINKKLLPLTGIIEKSGIAYGTFVNKYYDERKTSFTKKEVATLRILVNKMLKEKQKKIDLAILLSMTQQSAMDLIIEEIKDTHFEAFIMDDYSEKYILEVGNDWISKFSVYIYSDFVELHSISNRKKISSFQFDELDRVITYIKNY